VRPGEKTCVGVLVTLRRPDSRRHGATAVADSRLPQVIQPMLAVSTAEPFNSPAHIFEVLWTGVRALAFVERSSVRLQDRFGRDVTHRFPELGGLAARLRDGGVVLDGAIVCLDGRGRPDFERLRPRLGLDDPAAIAASAADAPVTFQAFDMLYRQASPLTGWALRRRKEALRATVRPGAAIAVPDWVEHDGVAFYEAAREHELEGIVAKESESRYVPGERSRSWLAVRVYPRSEFVIGGYTYGGRWDPRGARKPPREPFSSLLLGSYRNDGRLGYVGEVTGGFAAEDMEQLTRQLDDLAAADSPFADPPAPGRLVFWCRPELAASVRYGGWTHEGRLRFPVFEALRPDVPARYCVAEGN
jgi:bifunctional non-homologous end joining protein LigD